MATKRTTKKAETMAAKKAAVKEAPVKPVVTASVEAAEAPKTEVTETTVAKETAKAAEKKTAAPKKTTVRKTAEKKAAANTDVYVQFSGKELAAKEIVASVKKSWLEATGKKEEDIKDVKVYIKPEEYKAYYVVNGESEGSFIEL